MAHAMNYDVYASMESLEEARTLEPSNFFAQCRIAAMIEFKQTPIRWISCKA